jgi:hypothetical protein
MPAIEPSKALVPVLSDYMLSMDYRMVYMTLERALNAVFTRFGRVRCMAFLV